MGKNAKGIIAKGIIKGFIIPSPDHGVWLVLNSSNGAVIHFVAI